MQGFTSGMPVQADMRSLVFNLAVASGDLQTYKAVQKLYIEVSLEAVQVPLLNVITGSAKLNPNGHRAYTQCVCSHTLWPLT